MTFSLNAGAKAEGYRLEAYDSVGSTSAIALERAGSGDPGKLWIVARQQETGRGRRGRAWSTPPGNLAATLLIAFAAPSPRIATLGFVAGLSLADALDQVTGGKRIGIGVDGGTSIEGNRFELKWPNDVLANGAKLAGILLESSQIDRRFAVAIGIGVNLVAHPADTPYPATSLVELGSNVSAEALFDALSLAWCRNFAIWDNGEGLTDIRERWLARAAGRNSEVAVKVEGGVLRGIFETIDEDGRFVVRKPDGHVERITAGDVHFGAVASAAAD